MASVRSLGVHTPSALPYLIAESILSEDATEADYKWEVYNNIDAETGEQIEEEVLVTEKCVIWSQGGVVQKVFNVEIEDENVVQAVLTWFPTDQSVQRRSLTDNSSKSTKEKTQNSEKRPNGRDLGIGSEKKKKDQSNSSRSTSIAKSRALVVFLKVQAHVFFLSGPNHVISLPFEVERAFQSPRGLILQRKITPNEANMATPSIPAAPVNSFLFSSQGQSQSFHLSGSQGRSSFGYSRKGKSGRGDSVNAQFLEDLLKSTSLSNSDGLPRLFSFTDPLSEFGLVVGSDLKPSQSLSRSASSIKDSFQSLDRSEEVIYISPNDQTVEDLDGIEKPLVLVVTENVDSGTYSLWHASFAESGSVSNLKQTENALSLSKLRRRSSHIYTPATGATTPTARARDVTRDSFGPATRSKTAAISFSASQGASQSKQPTAEETFVSQLDPDYNLVQGPAKESRRVSSLLSRADLSTTFDRHAFQGLATQRTSLNASFGHQSRRGQSFGSQGDRLSLGGFSHGRLRASTPGSVSRMSFGTSVDDTIDDLDDLEDSQINDLIEEMHMGKPSRLGQLDSSRSLRKELLMIKIFEIPVGETAPIFKSFVGTNDSPREYPSVHMLQAPSIRERTGEISRRLFVHIIRRSTADHLEIELSIKRRRLAPTITPHQGAQEFAHRYALIPEVVRTQRPKGHLDAVKITERSQSRLLCLTRSPSGEQILSLHCGWAQQVPVAIKLCPLKLYNPFSIVNPLASTRKAAGLKRTLQSPENLQKFSSPDAGTVIDISDDNSRRHRLQVQISPQNSLVSEIIQLLRFLFPSNEGDIFLSIWWSMIKLCSNDKTRNIEWCAIISTIFTLVAPLIDPNTVKEAETLTPSTPKRQGAKQNVSNSAWDAMWKYDGSVRFPKAWNSVAWDWAKSDSTKSVSDSFKTRSRARTSAAATSQSPKNDFIKYCIMLSRQFNRSPLGTAVNDYWRRLSTKQNQDIRLSLVPKILVSLHLLREERKLNTVSSSIAIPEFRELVPVLAQLGHWLQWENWDWTKGRYYDIDGGSADLWAYEESRLKIARFPGARWEAPPSIFEWLERYNTPGFDIPFPSLDLLIGDPKSSPHFSHVVKDLKSKLTPRTAAVFKYLRNIGRNESDAPSNVELTAHSGIDVEMLETFPESAIAPIKENIMTCQAAPPTTWNADLLALVGRQDLNVLTNSMKRIKYDQQPVSGVLSAAIRDVHTVCQSADLGDVAHSSPESDRLLVTRLIFSEDRRFLEAVKMLEPLKQTIAECIPDPNWSEAEYLEAQKAVMQWVMLRTFALPPGNAMIRFDSKRPLLTEKYALHGFTTSCLMKPMNNVVTADRSNFTEEKYAWAFFHSGVSAGLTISRHAEGIDTSWIVFNKPSELTNKHAGLLLGLGLNGHLKNLAKWLSFKYLTPKHTMTTIGLLLGLSASFLGTMDTLVTRLLSVHITRMLPAGAAELNLSPLTQTAGLMGIGLLYHNTQHRRMTEIMLSEIEHIEISDPADPPDVLHDEGYRLAAGFALGLINLGKGNDLKGLHDMRLVERLLSVAVGTKSVDVVHILDQATAGATIATALIFMKTHNKSIAAKISVPKTAPLFDYVRPDIFLLRTLAKHLIMWDDIEAEHDWVARNLPSEYKDILLSNIRSLRSEYMPYYNIVGGLIWSVGLKYAGSGDIRVRDFLIGYLDQFMRLSRIPALKYDARLTRNTTRNCQDLIAISVATVMAGTGDLEVLRRLRVLHGRVNPDTPYGSHLAAHFALGALFIAGGTFTFGTSNLAVAALVCSFYPLFPMDVLDNKAHLQAFRHLWVLAVEPRCLIVRDIDTHRAISISMVLNMKDGTQQYIKAPCLLSDLDSIESIRTNTPDYWPAALDFGKNPDHLIAFRKTQTLQVRRRVALDAHSSTFTATLVALNDMQSSQAARLVWDWIFNLPIFRKFNMADASLILPVDGSSSLHLDARSTVIDNQLVLVAKANSSKSDDLRDLRCVLAWAENAQAERGRLRWLGGEVVERLRVIIAERARRIIEHAGK